MKKSNMPALPKINMPKVNFRQIADDFKTLDPKDPGAWPLVPRIIILTGMFFGLLAAAAWFGWSAQNEELELKFQEETKLKGEWLGKKQQAINLDEHIKQLAEIERSFGALLKQLPNASEMESLLIDINQAGLGRGLQFDLFKPGTEASRDFYAELPITLNVTGSYHDFGAFAGDIAKLSRIVTLNDITMAPTGKSGETLMLVATAKTFRYLDEAEVAEQKRKEREKTKGAKK
jgi:type IV pilus assembly protein PilO